MGLYLTLPCINAGFDPCETTVQDACCIGSCHFCVHSCSQVDSQLIRVHKLAREEGTLAKRSHHLVFKLLRQLFDKGFGLLQPAGILL
jgi:hypothetical protein